MIVQWLSAALLVSGSFFIFLSAVGLFRFPDIFSRMHAATKASSFGAVQMVLALAIWSPGFWTTLESLLIVIFIFLTAPVSAHLIARACYFIDIPMYEGTVIDELEGKYDIENEFLAGAASRPPEPPPLENR